MKHTVNLLFLACATLCGCASGPYVAPFEGTRSVSLFTVLKYSDAVKLFLATGTPEQAIKMAQTAVADQLKDPGSAQFRNVRVKPYLEGQVICGEVNGKNSYGGYAGFSPFVASTESATLYAKADWAELESAQNAGIRAAC